MKLVLCLFAVVAVVAAYPQQGAGFAKHSDAVLQAQNSFLIPRDAQIQAVQEGIELAAYERIPGNQRIDLNEILGPHVPPEVIKNLQSQVDQIGRN